MPWLFCSVLQLGAATRLEGITPAAVVNLLNYVRVTEKKKETHRNQRQQEVQRDEELCANSASLPQWCSLKMTQTVLWKCIYFWEIIETIN